MIIYSIAIIIVYYSTHYIAVLTYSYTHTYSLHSSNYST
jgi:hypothetical protein